MRNPCLEIALRELEAVGIRDVEQVHGGKHLQLRWQVNGHGLRVYNMPVTASDWRSVHNTRAGIRRMLREDGVLHAPERREPAPPPPPTPKPDRLSELERRVAVLEEEITRLKLHMS